MTNVTGKIGNNDVSILLGDITRTGVDAVIVPEFQSGASYGGVGGAVARSGALAGMEAYEQYVRTNGKQDFGTVILTPSGGGKSSQLLHVVSVGSGKQYEFDTVRTCIFKALEIAEQKGINSIAAPALGTGIIGDLTSKLKFPPRKSKNLNSGKQIA